MKILRDGPNKMELQFNDGVRVLVSYGSPVAVFLPEPSGYMSSGYWRTSAYFSDTTNRHINTWINDDPVSFVDQGQINAVIERR
jgi:hypothetical protein